MESSKRPRERDARMLGLASPGNPLPWHMLPLSALFCIPKNSANLYDTFELP